MCYVILNITTLIFRILIQLLVDEFFPQIIRLACKWFMVG